jgi:hypothetical protein
MPVISLSASSETVEPGGICNVMIASSIWAYACSVRLSLRGGWWPVREPASIATREKDQNLPIEEKAFYGQKI